MSYVLHQKRLAILLVIAIMFSLITFFAVSNKHNAEAATTSFRFVVMGDSRASTDGINETMLRELMTQVKGLSTQPAFVLFTGDQVQGGSDVETELYEWKAIVDDYYPINQFYPSLGNHEHDETVFTNVFNYLPNEQLSGYKRTAYYFDYGNARFITLNSDRKNSSGNYVITSSQRNWLDSTLQGAANNGLTHTIVQWHVPAYPIGSHYGGSLDASPADRDAFWDIIDKHNVTAAFVGHEHNYNRRLIDSSFNGNGYTFDNQIYQLTLGAAGAPLSSTVKDSKNVIVGPVAKYHYMTVDIADAVATFKVYDNNNSQLDSFTVDKSGSSSTSTTKSFQNGVYPTSSYAGNKDTYLSQYDATTNYGSSTTLLVDGDDPGGSAKDKSTIIEWDTSSIPSGSTVTSASITVNVTNPSGGSYELYRLKRNWSQSSSTWNEYSSGNNWEVAGANGTNDRGTNVLGTVTASSTGYYTVNLNSYGIEQIQYWVDGIHSNYGFILADSSETDGLDFSSSEDSTAGNRPKLTISYTTASTTASFQNGVYPTSSYAGNKDSYLSQYDATTNYGSSTTLLVDGDDPGGSTKDKSTLIEWDISSIPSGSTIKSASITLYVTNPSSGSYELNRMRRNWSQSSSTWNQYSSGNNWEVAGANGTNDRGTNVLGTVTASSTGHYTVNLNSYGIEQIQYWVDGIHSNYGFILSDSSVGDGLDFNSGETSTTSNRPKLTITYE